MMGTLTVRNVPDEAKHRFRQVAAAHGRSMEEHLRQLVIEAGNPGDSSTVREARATFEHAPVDPRAESRARIERLIELGRGLEDFEIPPRIVGEMRDIDFG